MHHESFASQAAAERAYEAALRRAQGYAGVIGRLQAALTSSAINLEAAVEVPVNRDSMIQNAADLAQYIRQILSETEEEFIRANRHA